MELRILDKDLNWIGILDDISSVQWLESYYDVGEVKIVAFYNSTNAALLVEHNYIYNPEISDSIAEIIETETVEGLESSITARARQSVARWDNRVVYGTEIITSASDILSIADKNRRGLSGNIGEAPVISFDTQKSWGTVLEVLTEILPSAGLGFEETFDSSTKNLTLSIYGGIDRTSQQSDNYIGFLSTEIGSLKSLTITKGAQEYKNVAIVGGQGEGTDRKIVTVSLAGDNPRREMWIDARDISKTYEKATATGKVDENGNPIYEYTESTYSDSEYELVLQSRGIEKLKEKMKTLEINAEVDSSAGITRENLGDIFPVRSATFDILMSARITEILTVAESTGVRTEITLSEFNPIGSETYAGLSS